MKDLLKKIAVPTVALIWAAFYIIECTNYGVKARLMIVPVFIGMVILYCYNTITDYIEWKKANKDTTAKKHSDINVTVKNTYDKAIFLRAITLFSSMAVYVFIVKILGFIIATWLFLLFVFIIMGERKYVIIAAMPPVVTGLLYLMFKIALRIPLPVGFLGF